jgi:hypothetical protein
MTFRDNYTQFGLFLLLSTGCWAPEVAPTTPKKSPAEIAGLAISSAEASPPSRPMATPQELHSQETQSVQQASPTEGSVAPVKPSEAPLTYPFQATLVGSSATLLGHGGGAILTIQAETIGLAQIQVLERKEDFYRVICQHCTKTHPFQAGWIQHSELKPLD